MSLNHKITYLFFSSADWDAPYWTNKQHTAKTIANYGHTVIFIESIGIRRPSFNSRDIKRMGSKLFNFFKILILGPKFISSNLIIITPISIPFFRGLVITNKLNNFILKFILKKTLKSLDITDFIIWSYHPYLDHDDTFFNSKPIIYHCVDDVSVIPGVDSKTFKTMEETLINKSNIVFVTSKALLNKHKKINQKTFFYPNVIDENLICKKIKTNNNSELSKIYGKKIVYHGSLSTFKIDFKKLIKFFSEHHNLNLILIGDEPEGQKDKNLVNLLTLKNVYSLGYRKGKDISSLLNMCDLGIIPLIRNRYTESMYPMKLYEFLACGLRVVTLNVQNIDKIKYAYFEDNFISFKNQILKQLNMPKIPSSYISRILKSDNYKERYIKMLNKINKYILK